MIGNQQPLILVFYLNIDMMQEASIIQPFVESVNEMISKKNANIMAFFVPTHGDERIECINPAIVKEADMEKINKMVNDIKESFSIGVDIDVPDEEITLCKCQNNPGGNCQCE